MPMSQTTETYDDQIVRLFLLAAVVWGAIGMSVGVFAAAQLYWPSLNFGVPWLTFSRIRPDHTFGVIFAFGGSALNSWRPANAMLQEHNTEISSLDFLILLNHKRKEQSHWFHKRSVPQCRKTEKQCHRCDMYGISVVMTDDVCERGNNMIRYIL